MMKQEALVTSKTLLTPDKVPEKSETSSKGCQTSGPNENAVRFATEQLILPNGLFLAKNGLFRKTVFREIEVIKPETKVSVAEHQKIETALLRALNLETSPQTRLLVGLAMSNLRGVAKILGTEQGPEKPTVRMGNHPKLPGAILFAMVHFLKAWHKKFGTEAAVLIHLEESPEDCADSMRVVPIEKCRLLFPMCHANSGAHVQFSVGDSFCPVCGVTANSYETKECCGQPMKPINLMLTAHSHGTMAAFCSGTDDTNEKPHRAFHMTFGNLDANPSMVLSFCDGDTRFPLQINDLFDIEYPEIEKMSAGWIEAYEKKKDEWEKAAKAIPKSSVEAPARPMRVYDLFEKERHEPVWSMGLDGRLNDDRFFSTGDDKEDDEDDDDEAAEEALNVVESIRELYPEDESGTHDFDLFLSLLKAQKAEEFQSLVLDAAKIRCLFMDDEDRSAVIDELEKKFADAETGLIADKSIDDLYQWLGAIT